MISLRARAALAAWGESRNGSTSIFFAGALLALAIAAGAAVDFARATDVKEQLQAAVDSALLNVASNAKGDVARIEQGVRAYLAASGKILSRAEIVDVTVTVTTEGTATATARARTPTSLMRAAGLDSIVISATSQIVLGAGTAEVALVLDTTGSMSGAKIANLKTAATQLIEHVAKANLVSPPRFKASLVPFSNYVNIGVSRRNESWMDVPADYEWSEESCGNRRPVLTTFNCRTVTSTHYNDGVPYQSTHEVCDHTYGDPVYSCETVTHHVRFRGCAGSRNYPLDTRDDSYGTRVPGLMNISCASELTPLTTNMDVIKSGIASLSASGETYIPAGLLWGWTTLSPGEPFAGGAVSNDLRKYLVLMTDGANTLSPSYPSHNGGSASVADQLVTELCANIRASKIVVFTVAFDVTDPGIKNILRACAEPSGRFYDARDAGQLTSAFDEIGQAVVSLRLTR